MSKTLFLVLASSFAISIFAQISYSNAQVSEPRDRAEKG